MTLGTQFRGSIFCKPAIPLDWPQGLSGGRKWKRLPRTLSEPELACASLSSTVCQAPTFESSQALAAVMEMLDLGPPLCLSFLGWANGPSGQGCWVHRPVPRLQS